MAWKLSDMVFVEPDGKKLSTEETTDKFNLRRIELEHSGTGDDQGLPPLDIAGLEAAVKAKADEIGVSGIRVYHDQQSTGGTGFGNANRVQVYVRWPRHPDAEGNKVLADEINAVINHFDPTVQQKAEDTIKEFVPVAAAPEPSAESVTSREPAVSSPAPVAAGQAL